MQPLLLDILIRRIVGILTIAAKYLRSGLI